MPSAPKDPKPNAAGCAERKPFRTGDYFSTLLDLDIGEPGSAKADRTADQNRDRKRVTELISTWMRSKALKKEVVHSARRGTDYSAIVVGEPAVDMPESLPQSPQSSVE